MTRYSPSRLPTPIAVVLLVAGVFLNALSCAGLWRLSGVDTTNYAPGHVSFILWFGITIATFIGVATFILMSRRLPSNRQGMKTFVLSIAAGCLLSILIAPPMSHKLLIWEWQRHCPDEPYNCFLVGTEYLDQAADPEAKATGQHFLEIGCAHDCIMCCERLE